MAKKYKLSRKYINEFFGLFGTTPEEKKKKKLDKLIAKDPKLKAIDDRITALNKAAAQELKDDEDFMRVMKDLGIDIK